MLLSSLFWRWIYSYVSGYPTTNKRKHIWWTWEWDFVFSITIPVVRFAQKWLSVTVQNFNHEIPYLIQLNCQTAVHWMAWANPLQKKEDQRRLMKNINNLRSTKLLTSIIINIGRLLLTASFSPIRETDYNWALNHRQCVSGTCSVSMAVIRPESTRCN